MRTPRKAMMDRVEVDVVKVIHVIPIIANHVFPLATLPDTAAAVVCSCAASLH
jgi:hypothetical protein